MAMARALQKREEARKAALPYDSSWAFYLEGVAAAYGNNFRMTGNTALLDMAIQTYEQALAMTPPYHADRKSRVHDLSLGHYDRFVVSRSLPDLDRSIHLYNEFLGARQWLSKHQHLSIHYPQLAFRYELRFDATRNVADLNTAIQLVQQVLDWTHLHGFDKTIHVFNLGTRYAKRYGVLGATADLKMSIQLVEEALSDTSSDSPAWHPRASYLIQLYQDRYSRFGNSADIDDATRLCHSIIHKLSPTRHSDRASIFQSLGLGYYYKYEKQHKKADLNKSIENWQTSLTELSEEQPVDNDSRMISIAYLGKTYNSLFSDLKNTSHLDEAVQSCQEVVDNTPPGSQEQAEQLHILATAYQNRWKSKKIKADQEAAIRLHQEALDYTSASVQDRLLSSRPLLSLYAENNAWQEAYEATCTILGLFHLLAPRSLENSDKQFMLSSVTGLASDAASIALNAGKNASEAVRVLELGRGLITNSLAQLRNDVSDLAQDDSSLGEEYSKLRDQVDVSSASDAVEDADAYKTTMKRGAVNWTSRWYTKSNQRFLASSNLDDIISHIREKPGYESFQNNLTTADVQAAAAHGPIILINVSDYRGDALLVEKAQIRCLPLPQLKMKDIRIKAKIGNPGSLPVLKWMWDTITNPILKALGFVDTPSNGIWPHVWWIPTGVLSKFPLHAAGYHTNASNNCVLDRVISSYSSTIKALVHGRRVRPEKTQSSPKKALLISMEITPGHPRLPFATKEVGIIHDLCTGMGLDLVASGRKKRDIMENLPKCDIFHFAGHGYTDKRDPQKSYLLLKDSNTDPFTVANLMELNLHKHAPFLAYLSACGTGQIKDERFSDESIHLTSACQLAGFQHAIGTLWQVNDGTCADMARFTYQGLRDGDMTDESVCASSLHHATRQVREDWLKGKGYTKGRKIEKGTRDIESGSDSDDDEGATTALAWVPYVHFGV